MSLKQKAAVMVLIFMTANIAVGFGMHRLLVAPEFAALEQSEAAKDMYRVEQAIRREIFHLEESAADWAVWDDTYEFVRSGDARFIESNINTPTLEKGLHFILITDLRGRVLARVLSDPDTEGQLDVPELPVETWDPTHPLLSGDDEWVPVSGIMTTSHGPMLIASRYIFDSEGKVETNGHLLMGRFLNRSFIAGLGQRTRIDLDIQPVYGDDALESVRDALLDSEAEKFIAVPNEGDGRLDVYMLMADLAGNPAVIVRAGLPRDIAHRADSVSELTMLFLLVQGAVLALLMLVSLNRAILAPLLTLSHQLLAIRRTSDLTIRLGTERRDEIGELGREFDRMLSQLEEQIRERRIGERALRRSGERLREAQAVAGVGSWELNVATGDLWWSDEMFRMHELDPGDLTPTLKEFADLIHPEERAHATELYRASLRERAKRFESELRVALPSGSMRQQSRIWNIEYDEAGDPQRFFGTVRDVTERHRAEEGVRRAAAVFETATEAIAIAGADGRIIDVNAAFVAITGHSREQAIGQTSSLLDSGRHDQAFFDEILRAVDRDSQWEGEIWIRHREGKAIPAWVSIGRTMGAGGSTEQVVFVFNDMTERKESEELIVRQANFDKLSGIPNRSLFADRLARETLLATRENTLLGLFFIDLDDFKGVNDTLGHAAGDEVLKEVAVRIRDCIREVDTVARLGGDEFAVITPELTEPVDAELVATRIVAALGAPHIIQGCEVVTRASVGITLFPRDTHDGQALLRNADVAMYRAKEAGGNTSRFFTAEMNESALRRAQLETQLQHALERGEFRLDYQPIVALPDGRLVGVEALLRWKNSELGEVMPAEFIPVAERKGFITAMGAWVLKTACCQVKSWQEAGLPDLRLAVNLSTYELNRGDPEASTFAALSESGLAPECLELEVTESMLAGDVDRISQIFRNLRGLGVRLSIDDFGTGYSSLSYLRNFPFDVLKIDRSFVHDAHNHSGGVPLLRAIVAMANSLGLQVIAEGVETSEQCELVCELGCGFSQGYYFSPPLSAEDFEQFVEYPGKSLKKNEYEGE